MLELVGASKRFGTTRALERTDLLAEDGRTTVLIGPSGCGKSTILRLINGLIEPDTGQVRVNGAPLTHQNVLEMRRRMGYVIQDGGLFPHLTARKNISLMARYLRWNQKQIAERMADLVALTHFPASALSRYPAELSGGQRQRVSLMRALMLDPDFLLLDEPLGALDPMIRAELQRELRDIFRALRRTVVLVTHDMGEAGFFGDKIVLMREGRIVQQGVFEDLVNCPEDDFVEAFINAQRSPLSNMGKAAS
ncbi:MAG: ATP-binding cassette domain-containing protein [Phycisphaerae bacterium]|nr:ATP-binding cassette domain-containing protein [Phycisphaerae bacterium]